MKRFTLASALAASLALGAMQGASATPLFLAIDLNAATPEIDTTLDVLESDNNGLLTVSVRGWTNAGDGNPFLLDGADLNVQSSDQLATLVAAAVAGTFYTGDNYEDVLGPIGVPINDGDPLVVDADANPPTSTGTFSTILVGNALGLPNIQGVTPADLAGAAELLRLGVSLQTLAFGSTAELSLLVGTLYDNNSNPPGVPVDPAEIEFQSATINLIQAQVSAPGTALMLAAGLLGIGARARRRA